MRRKIKFRIYHNIKRRFIDFDSISIRRGSFHAYIIEGRDRLVATNANSVLLEYTGLKDADGIDICEGDIYREEVSIDDEQGIDEVSYFVCAWVKCMASFCWITSAEYLLEIHNEDKWPSDDEHPYTLNTDEMDKITIIANAYSHPELLLK